MWEEDISNPKGLADSKQYDAVFNELMQECKHSAPGARLSARLRTALERMRPEERRAVCSRTRDGCAPLFVACLRGNVELVEYLVHVCAADLEQRGVYEVPHDRSTHSVTPLWCAAVAGRLEVLRALADAGADLDAGSDSGSTPVRSACFMTHLNVVKLLVERGADIHRPNHNGGTCLINAVQSVPLCTLLLRHGARADAQDMQLKTALHYAVQEHRLETARLLLDRGADPHLRSRAGDDALRTACLKGAVQIVQLLVARVHYEPAQVADAYELLGATQLDEFNDVHGALLSWRRATALRHAHSPYLEKRNWEGAAQWALGGGGAALGGAREWRSAAELEALAADVDALRTAALLVAVRVLGPAHKDCVFRLMYRGASYADAFRYQRCIDLWLWALEIRIEKDSLLYSDTCQTASALTRLLLDARSGRLERAAGLPRARDVLRTFRLLAAALPPARAALAHRPVHRRQADNYDRALRCASHLLHLLADPPPADRPAADRPAADRPAADRPAADRPAADRPADDRPADDPPADDVAAAVRALVAADVRSAHTGDTLLHLCVSRLNVVRSTYFADENAGGVFPSAAAVALLLRCGADPRARNEARSTALHVAAVPYNYCGELVEALLEAGAHLDTPNRFGDRAADLLALNRDARVRPLRHVSLRCLAARALLAACPRPLPRHLMPAELERFLELHRP